MNSIYQCPVCGAPLQLSERHCRCEQNHCFDVAREGYVNLLLAQHKKSREAGDSKAMMVSRRQFLQADHYDCLPGFLSEQINQLFGRQPIKLLDAGCGEGYYTGFIQTRLGERLQGWGIDISKPGIVMAAKRYQTLQWAVASSFRLPLQDNSLDVVLRIYAPGDAAEFARVLKTRGYLITAIPGPRHLFGLKSVIYDTPELHSGEESCPAGFECIGRHTIDEQIRLADAQQIADLLAMTPYYWHLSQERQQQVLALPVLESEISFVVNIYQKR